MAEVSQVPTTSDEQQAVAARKRARRLGLARAELAALPDLMDVLARCQTERPPGEGGSSGKPGSRPPLRMDVLHLTDTHRKPGWEGDDPRLVNLTERHGVAPLLETWTRVLTEEMPTYPDLAERATVRTEAATLIEHWEWIGEQQWADELADDVIRVVGWVKVALAIRPEPRYRCPQCGARAYISTGGFLMCNEGHEQSIRDLEAQYRRRPPAPTAEVCGEFGITPGRLYQWHKRKKVRPTREEGRTLFWLPWDIFCIVNPDIATALEARDKLEATG